MSELDTAKKRLVEALKDKSQKYWELLKNWCRRRIAKEEFDSKAKALLGDANIQLHNEFLFAILVKCQLGTHGESHLSARTASHLPHPVAKAKQLKPDVPYVLTPYGALDSFQYHKPLPSQLRSRDLDTILLCSNEMLLPDLSTLHIRMLLGAWETGLEGVSEASAQLLLLALKNHLKNVIMACIARQDSWRLREGCFQHSFGLGVASSVVERKRSHQATEMERLARSSSRPLLPITLFNLRDALQMTRAFVPVHTVYACNMERVLGGMWHHSREEEEQMKVVNEWRRKTFGQPAPFSLLSKR